MRVSRPKFAEGATVPSRITAKERVMDDVIGVDLAGQIGQAGVRAELSPVSGHAKASPSCAPWQASTTPLPIP